MQRTERRRVIVVGGITLAIGTAIALLSTRFSTGAAVDVAIHPITMAIILVAASFPIMRWAVDGDTKLFQVVLAGAAAKVLGTYLRFTLTGRGDNRRYHEVATDIAGILSEGIVGPSDVPAQFGGDGSGRLAYGLGWLYYFTGSDRLTGFVMFAFIGFVGSLCFYRAAIKAVPELDHMRFALLLFFMPSMLFWPSTIGKEAWMIGFVGLAVVGMSTLLTRRFSIGALVLIGIGLIMAGQIRPHMAALALVAFVAALAWPGRVGGSRLQQIVTVVIALAFLSVAMSEVATFFGAEEGEVNDILDFAQGRTDTGGSAFTPVRITGPLNLIPGAVSVMFRPFLNEIDSALQLIGALESTVLVLLGALSFRRLRRVPSVFRSNGYVRFAVFYTLGFVVAFSVISNFGILARQRAQLWPVFLVLLALAPVPSDSDETEDVTEPDLADQTRAEAAQRTGR